jgi:hypothetical protein
MFARSRENAPRLQPFYRRICLVLLVALVPLTASCYGRFPLTKALYRINGEVTDNKWVHSILLWVFWWFPVYWLAMLGDAVILNLIEFWTGNTIQISSTTTDDGKTVVLAPSADGREAVLTVSENGQVLAVQRFARQADGSIQMLDGDGKLMGQVLPTEEGGFDLTDAEGSIVHEIPGAAIASLRAI